MSRSSKCRQAWAPGSLALLLAVIAAICLYAGFTTRLATANVETTQRFEKEIRAHRVVRTLTPPSWRKTPPKHIDYYLHYAFFAPYGVLAAVLASLATRHFGKTWRVYCWGIALGCVLLIPLYDEYRQWFIPNRTASWADALWAWGGIVSGFVLVAGIQVMAKLLKGSTAERFPPKSSG